MIYSRVVKKKRSQRRHRIYNNGQPSHTTSIKSLPRDLLVKVVATVASDSFIDLHNIKICCKDFFDAAGDSYVWRTVSLDTFPLIQWSRHDKKLWFLNRCRECENPESIYREGLLEYFDNPNGKNIDGLEMLKVAAQKGHKEAKHMCGMILLCSEDNELKKQGLEHMRFLRKSKCVVSSRNKVKQLLKFMWKNNEILGRNQSPLCNLKSTCKGWRVKRDKWALLDDDDDDDDDGGADISLCENCRWDYELDLFHRLFNVH